jgi:type I restriction enzyme S subunit
MIAEGYKDTEIGVIPDEWDVVKLAQYGKCIRGVSYKPKDISKEYTDETVCVLRSNNIKNNLLNYDKVVYVDRKAVNDNQLLQDNDIAICMSNGSKTLVGKNATFISNNEKVSIGAFCALFRTTNDSNPIFVKNLLSSNLYKKQIDILLSGSAINNLKNSDIEGLKFQLPSLKEQEKIADILSTADDKINAIQMQINRAETLKKGLLQKLLSEGIGNSEFKDSELGKIPKSWDITTVGKSSKNFDGQRVPLKSEDRQEIQGDYPYYGAQGIIDYVNDYIFDGEYLLVAEDGENVKGQKYDIAFVVSGKFWVNNHAHILQANDNMDLYFISSILNHINIIKYVTGTGQPKLNKAQLNSIKIPLPPLEEQKQIAEILSTADKKLEVLRAKKEKHETLKKGLLQKLLSGEVRV